MNLYHGAARVNLDRRPMEALIAKAWMGSDGRYTYLPGDRVSSGTRSSVKLELRRRTACPWRGH